MTLINLPWLPAPPRDFRARCRAEKDGSNLQFLANHSLNLNELNVLAKAVTRSREMSNSAQGLTSVRLGLLSNATTSLLVPALIATAIRHGILLDVVETPFNQGVQQALNPESEINLLKPDIVLLAYDLHSLSAPQSMTDADDSAVAIAETLGSIDAMRRGIAAASGATVIAQTIVPPPAPFLGSYDRRLPGSPLAHTEAFNRGLLELLEDSGDVLLDTAHLAASIGLEYWHDATQWHIAKLPFSQDVVPLYADHVVRLIGAIKGKSRKCLVLDLDNTVWGGVVGDDGLHGISLGQGDPVGEAFLEVQRTALHLRSLGIILAVSSKNDDEVARQPFRNHPDMLLREDDIAVFQANWADKATNIEAIATALDIGVDSLVLLDDNPAERAQVREALPAVAAPELPDDPALFAQTLLAAGYFEATRLSSEDLIRADDYSARAKRIKLQGATRDLESYLQSLEMEIVFAPFDATGRGRITQLINKSNQFNLTTRRYTEREIAEMQDDPLTFTLQVRLRDRFGDNGMISVVIARSDGKNWEIDTWLMSCRVLGRCVEDAVLIEIVAQAMAAGANMLIGRFIPSGRNELVRGHYSRLGFEPSKDDGLYHLDLRNFVPARMPMSVKRLEEKARA